MNDPSPETVITVASGSANNAPIPAGTP